MASWPFMAERCQFHLAQNAIHHAPTTAIRKRIGSQLREIWNAKNLAAAEAELKSLLEAYRKNAPELAAWLEVAIPEGLAVFTLPEQPPQTHGDLEPDRTRRPARAEATHLEIRVFPNNASRLRLVTAVLVEIDETWLASTQPYINWNSPDARSGHQPISRHRVA